MQIWHSLHIILNEQQEEKVGQPNHCLSIGLIEPRFLPGLSELTAIAAAGNSIYMLCKGSKGLKQLGLRASQVLGLLDLSRAQHSTLTWRSSIARLVSFMTILP